MKPTRGSDFAFDPGLVVCLSDEIDDCELRVSFQESLSLQFELTVARRSPLFIASG